uniref:Fibronectin type-II domain-containing protein n=1 Tax=Oryctolagus cuniculus TaxID=9986 RepID=A0A5F9CWD2_RABIT
MLAARKPRAEAEGTRAGRGCRASARSSHPGGLNGLPVFSSSTQSNARPGWAGAVLDNMSEDNKCVFPFTFGNKKHFDCIDHPLLHSWCSLSEIYNGKWKYCTDDDRARCVFPFTYKGHVFNSCITLGSVFQMSWCSLSPNYDQDHAWKYCY